MDASQIQMQPDHASVEAGTASAEPSGARRDEDGLASVIAEVRVRAKAGGVPDLSERDAMLALADRAETLRALLKTILDDCEGPEPPRFDLALAACEVAAKTDQLDVANCFAQTAIDFLTGTYDPSNFDVEVALSEAEVGL